MGEAASMKSSAAPTIETDNNHRFSSFSTPRPLYTLWSVHIVVGAQNAHGLALRYWARSTLVSFPLARSHGRVRPWVGCWSLAKCGHGKTASAFFHVLRSHQGSNCSEGMGNAPSSS